VAGVGLQQRVLELLADFLGVHAHGICAVGVPGATPGPHVQRVRVGLVPFIRGRVDFQFHCEKKGQCFIIVNMIGNYVFRGFKDTGADEFLRT